MGKKMTESALFDVFQAAIENGIIDITQTSQLVEEMNRKKILNEHPYSVFYQESTNYWYSYLPDKTKKTGRKQIKRRQRKSLEDAIVAFYSAPKEDVANLNCLRKIYPEWLDYLSSRSNASTTIRRYDCDWRRWLENDPIVDRPISTLDYIALDKWAHEMVRGINAIHKPMTSKQYYNVITIMKGCLDYAHEKKLVDENPFYRIRIKKTLFYVPQKDFNDDRDQVFTESEMPEVRELALEDYFKLRDEVALAVFVISYTGMRAGEVCALRWKSFNEDFTEVFVTAQVVRDEKLGKDGVWMQTKWKLVEHTKSSNGRRNLYVPEKVRELLFEHKKYKKPQSEEDLVFARANGHFITCNQTYRRTVKYSNKIQTYRKGTHKLRKTYLSALYDGGVHESTLSKIAGHYIDGKTLHKHYLKDRKTEDEVRDKIEKILK